MRVTRRIATGAMAVAVAFAAGFWVQNDAALALRAAEGAETALPPAPVTVAEGVLSGDQNRGLPELSDLSPPALTGGAEWAARVGPADDWMPRPRSGADMSYSAYGIACHRPEMGLASTEDGMLTLSLDAPCQPGTFVEIAHGALHFRLKTDMFGGATTEIPALAEKSWVEATFADGSRVIKARTVEGFDADRTTILWSEPATWMIGGKPPAFLPRLVTTTGDPVEVLSLTGDQAAGLAMVVTPDLCGEELHGTLIDGDDADGTRPITVAVPGCDLTGAQIVLDIRRLLQGPGAAN